MLKIMDMFYIYRRKFTEDNNIENKTFSVVKYNKII